MRKILFGERLLSRMENSKVTEQFPRVQLSWFFGGEGQLVVRGDDVDSTQEMFTNAVAKHGERIMESAVAMRNFAKLKGVIDDAKAGTKPSVAPSGNQSSGPARAGAGLCEHNMPWDDLGGQIGKNGEPFKYRYYCAFKSNNWKDRCRPRDSV